MRRLTRMLAALLLLFLTVNLSEAQDVVMLTLEGNADGLTLYVDGTNVDTLPLLALQVAPNERYQLVNFPTLAIALTQISSPTCLTLARSGASVDLPALCESATQVRQDVASNLVFWVADDGSPRILTILRENNPLMFCNPVAAPCSIPYPISMTVSESIIIPTLAATATVNLPTDTPTRIPTLPPLATNTEPAAAGGAALVTATPEAASGRNIVIINTDALGKNIRSGPGTGFGTVGSLSQNETAQVVAKTCGANFWWLVELSDGNRGYILANIISVLVDGEPVNSTAAGDLISGCIETDEAVDEAPVATSAPQAVQGAPDNRDTSSASNNTGGQNIGGSAADEDEDGDDADDVPVGPTEMPYGACDCDTLIARGPVGSDTGINNGSNTNFFWEGPVCNGVQISTYWITVRNTRGEDVTIFNTGSPLRAATFSVSFDEDDSLEVMWQVNAQTTDGRMICGSPWVTTLRGF